MSAFTMKRGLFFGLLSAVGGLLYLNRGGAGKEDDGSNHPAPAFAGSGGATGSAVQVRDAGASQMRDRPGAWDKVDEASDSSFPASDPPATY